MKKLHQGFAWKFGDDISTDLIVPGRLSHLRSNLPELAKHVLEDADTTFAQKVQPGDYIVAGKNFGTGSSREHAAEVIRLSHVRAVIAKSFARIFFRNGSNVGLWLIEADTDQIEAGDLIEVDLENSCLIILNKQTKLPCKAPDGILSLILLGGGLIPYLQKHGGYLQQGTKTN